MTAIVVLVATAHLLVVAAVVARHRAASAADLAALAAAGRLALGQPGACQLAVTVAGDAGARIVSCRTSATGVVDLVAEVRPGGPAGRFGPARVRARAGP